MTNGFVVATYTNVIGEFPGGVGRHSPIPVPGMCALPFAARYSVASSAAAAACPTASPGSLPFRYGVYAVSSVGWIVSGQTRSSEST
jgi:hypothetical protein